MIQDFVSPSYLSPRSGFWVTLEAASNQYSNSGQYIITEAKPELEGGFQQLDHLVGYSCTEPTAVDLQKRVGQLVTNRASWDRVSVSVSFPLFLLFSKFFLTGGYFSANFFKIDFRFFHLGKYLVLFFLYMVINVFSKDAYHSVIHWI